MSDVLRIHGAVRRDGEPAEGAYLHLMQADGQFIAERRTGPDGTYSFHTTPGRWTVVCRAAGSAEDRREVEGSQEVSADFDLST